MTRYSGKAADEVPDKRSDSAERRTRPDDCRPYSPKRIEALYRKARVAPNLNVDGGDGLVDRKRHAFEVKIQRPQFSEDQCLPDYDNDVSGERSWLRGGQDGGESNPCFDRGKFDKSSVPPKPASGLKATGQDAPRSPFSSAYIKPSFNRS
jgi:hypothetical protein